MNQDATEERQHGILLGQWVRQRRQALGLTGEQVAERMGIDVPGNFIVQLENGGRKRMISQPRLGQLAQALEVTEMDLMQAAGMFSGTDGDPAEQDDSDIDSLMLFGAKTLTPEGKALLREHLEVLRRHYGDLAEEVKKRNAR